MKFNIFGGRTFFQKIIQIVKLTRNTFGIDLEVIVIVIVPCFESLCHCF